MRPDAPSDRMGRPIDTSRNLQTIGRPVVAVEPTAARPASSSAPSALAPLPWPKTVHFVNVDAG